MEVDKTWLTRIKETDAGQNNGFPNGSNLRSSLPLRGATSTMKLVTGSKLCSGKPRLLNRTADDGDDEEEKASGETKSSMALVLLI